MNWITILGLVAGALTTFSGFPQLVKIFKTKQTRDLSLNTFIMLSVGGLLWLIYGLVIEDIPLIATNTLALISSSSILILKLIYK